MDCPRIDLARYVVVPVWYGCNNRCGICMLGPLKRILPVVDFAQYKQLLLDARAGGRHDGLILSGGEVTTFEGLEPYVRFAASLGCFRRIQIQTNGRRLADGEYLKALTAWGVNEFFVSIHGLGSVHDAITGVDGSFAELERAMDNLQACDVNVITNTVLTSVNATSIASLLGWLGPRAISEHHVWNYYPMAPTDSDGRIVSLRDFLAHLSDWVAAVGGSGRPLVLKGFPECLCPGPPCFIDNEFPLALLPELFWEAFDRNRFGVCVHKHGCTAQRCWGLSAAYQAKFGDERELLRPILSTPPRAAGGMKSP